MCSTYLIIVCDMLPWHQDHIHQTSAILPSLRSLTKRIASNILTPERGGHIWANPNITRHFLQSKDGSVSTSFLCTSLTTVINTNTWESASLVSYGYTSLNRFGRNCITCAGNGNVNSRAETYLTKSRFFCIDTFQSWLKPLSNFLRQFSIIGVQVCAQLLPQNFFNYCSQQFHNLNQSNTFLPIANAMVATSIFLLWQTFLLNGPLPPLSDS